MESVIDCVILLVVSLLVFFIIKRTSIVGKTGALMVLIYVVYTIYIFTEIILCSEQIQKT